MRKVMGGTACPDCGKDMVRDERLVSWIYRGHKIEYMQPGYYCADCGNCDLTDKDIAKTEGKLQAFRKKVDDMLAPALSPMQIKRLRESFSLSQKRAGRLFGGGPMAFSKYERGENKPHKSTEILFRLLTGGKIKIRDIENAALIKVEKAPTVGTDKAVERFLTRRAQKSRPTT